MHDVLSKIRSDIAAYAKAERCHAGLSFWLRMILVTPGFQFVLCYRLEELLLRIPVLGRVLRRLVWWLSCLVFGAEIAMAAEIDGGLYIPHPYGIVIGRSRIGADVCIMQNVTIGTKHIEDRSIPVIEAGVVLGAGCCVLGEVVVGAGSAVGANAVVLASLPPNSVAVGVPAKIVQPTASP